MGNLLSSDLLRQCALAITTLDDRGPLILCRASATCHQLLAIAEEVARRRCEAIGRHGSPAGSQPWRRVLGYLCPELRLCKALACHNTSQITCMVELGDGRHIVSGSEFGAVRVWDLETGSCMQHLTGHTGPVNSLVVLPDSRIVSGSEDNSLRVWNQANRTNRRCGRIGRFSCAHHLIQTAESHEHDTRVIVAELDDGRIVSGGSLYTENEGGAMKCFLRVWDVMTGSCTQRLTALTYGWYMTMNIVQLADRRIVSGDFHGSMRVWDLATDSCTMHLTGPHMRGPVYSIAVLADSHIADSLITISRSEFGTWPVAAARKISQTTRI